MPSRSTGPSGRPDAGSPRSVPIPKPGGGIRWLTLLDPIDDARYREAVRPLAARIERALGPEVLAIRARREGGDWTLAPTRPARASWRRRLRRALETADPETVFATADVRDCYPSIAPETIARLLGPEAAPAVAVLRRLADRGVRGLPIGPEASAILANAVLARLDRAVRRDGVEHLRWVDDIALWGRARDVRAALSALHGAAAANGLELHPDKTRVLDERDLAGAVLLGNRDSSIIAAP